MTDEKYLTPLEAEALRRCIANTKVAEWRPLLEAQAAQLVVKARSEKTTGYYVDFDVPASLRIADMADEANKTPMETAARHPDGKNAIFFIVYVLNGVLHFMEAASSSDWPLEEEAIRFDHTIST